ncbi:unnamed protein product [Symbiodinium natans]|uniref:Uncharacterized protein n=1 Tax=Symbiodinium natans TaxID=878477 RepID=A0A812IB61_9DINO|nr:unnamed protein product [Symbiodinium natans]
MCLHHCRCVPQQAMLDLASILSYAGKDAKNWSDSVPGGAFERCRSCLTAEFCRMHSLLERGQEVQHFITFTGCLCPRFLHDCFGTWCYDRLAKGGGAKGSVRISDCLLGQLAGEIQVSTCKVGLPT